MKFGWHKIKFALKNLVLVFRQDLTLFLEVKNKCLWVFYHIYGVGVNSSKANERNKIYPHWYGSFYDPRTSKRFWVSNPIVWQMKLILAFYNWTWFGDPNSRWHCRSKPPHFWSLCNGLKSWNNVSRPTFPSCVLATFAPSHSISYFQMPPAFHLALGLFQLQSRRHRNASQNPCQSQTISTLMLSPKCLSRFQRLRRILRPNCRFRMTFSKGLSKAWLSLQSSWWTCDNMRPIPKRILRLEPT